MKVRASANNSVAWGPGMLGPEPGKPDAAKQEMVRMNTDLLEISELKWMGMGEFNSDDHYIYYCG